MFMQCMCGGEPARRRMSTLRFRVPLSTCNRKQALKVLAAVAQNV